jgi:hypothetical protein
MCKGRQHQCLPLTRSLILLSQLSHLICKALCSAYPWEATLRFWGSAHSQFPTGYPDFPRHRCDVTCTESAGGMSVCGATSRGHVGGYMLGQEHRTNAVGTRALGASGRTLRTCAVILLSVLQIPACKCKRKEIFIAGWKWNGLQKNI